MKIGIISGSHRKISESERIARYIEQELTTKGIATYLFSLASNPLPLWDESVWEGAEAWKTVWGPISNELQSCEGFVIISPEWSGMVPAGLKNFFLLCSSKEIGHKPGLLVGVSSGVSGSYPITELRSSSYKNTRICYIPEHVIVRNSTEMLKGSEPSGKHDESLRKRITYSLDVLVSYTKALSSVRESGVLNYKDFANGM